MGSYCGVFVGDYELLSNKSYPIATDLFYPEDRAVHKDTDGETVYQYRAPVFVVMERLLARGASIELAKVEHEEHFTEVREWFEDRLADDDWDTWEKEPTLKSLEFLNQHNFERWKILIAEHMKDRPNVNIELDYQKLFKHRSYIEEEQDLLFMEEIVDGGFLGLDGLTDNGILAILSTVPDKINTFVKLEYTDIVNAGYVAEDEELASTVHDGTIILTEGVSDRRFIESAINLLRPHVARNFKFLDFEEFKLQASASNLVHTIKAFNAAGIANNMVAVFDNDTAAKDAQKVLSTLKLNKNFRVINLPEIELLKNYPTIGPQGSVNMDVNGLAGSIELYFPTEALKDASGSLYPVIWKGYVEGQKQYQGEVANKHEIQRNFDRIIDSIKNGESKVSDYQFENLRRVLETVFGFSFHRD